MWFWSKGADGDVVLLGFPFDEGVRRNGGRVGAKLGPSTMRRYVRRYAIASIFTQNIFSFVQRMGTIINPEYDFLDLR